MQQHQNSGSITSHEQYNRVSAHTLLALALLDLKS
jgi:hypothetical protein